MNLTPTEEQQALVATLAEFVAGEIRPIVREAEADRGTPERISKQLFEMGISAPIPEAFGGQGTFDALTSVMIAEELASGDPGIAYSVLTSGVAAKLIDMHGTPEDRHLLLPQILEGAKTAVALAEASGSDQMSMNTVATPEGSDWSLSGIKYLVAEAQQCSILIVAALAGGSPTFFRLKDLESVAFVEEDKLGLHSARTYKVLLEDVPGVPIGRPGEATAGFHRARLMTGAIALGLACAAGDYSAKYAQERTAFGRPIGAFQGISFKIADRAMEVETARLLLWDAACKLDRGDADAAVAVRSACAHAVHGAVSGADDAVQILGGHGYMQDHPVEMWYRDAMTLSAIEPSASVSVEEASAA